MELKYVNELKLGLFQLTQIKTIQVTVTEIK